jgi:hypothetical protein
VGCWRDKAIEYCADEVIRQAPSRAWCLKIPRPSARQATPYSALFWPSAGHLRILFASCESPKSWSLPRPRDRLHSWCWCKENGAIPTLQAEPEEKNQELMTPFFGIPSSKVWPSRGGSCTMRWGRTQRMQQVVSSGNAVIPGMEAFTEILGVPSFLGRLARP